MPESSCGCSNRTAQGRGQMSETKVGTLSVPGASLYYSMCGSGPVLLVIAGGSGDAESFRRYTEHLAGQYTVVTYDRRGFWRSPLEHPDQQIGIETHSDDVHHLLAALGTEPAYVLGFSIGALIGLDLTLRHPDQVRTLVAHEPPAGQLLSDAERPDDGLLELYQREGGGVAIRKFAASIGVDPHNRESKMGLPQGSEVSAEHNREAFFKHDAGAVGRYRLDIAALKAAPTRVVLAGGCEGRQYFPYRCAAKLADCLGSPLEEFPGNHAGCPGDPGAFAEKLWEVLGG
jgi:pimeloyl-ACP methyl ester carboxylesterase